MRALIRQLVVVIAVGAVANPAFAGAPDGDANATRAAALLGLGCCWLSLPFGLFALAFVLNRIFRKRPLDDFPEDRP